MSLGNILKIRLYQISVQGLLVNPFSFFIGRTDTESIPSQGKTTLPCEIPNTTTNREAERQPQLSKSFRENRFSRSVTKARKKRAISCTDISIPHSSPISNMLSSAPLNRSSRSLQTLGSLPSIHNSWTRIFSALSTSLSLSTTSSVDDASYDIINREEVESNFVNHGVEEDVIKLAIPVGCAFDVSCQTMWRLFKVLIFPSIVISFLVPSSASI